MKLNRKGYMLVEIVLASVLAMGVAYYLLNLTYKFKNTNEDIYQSIYYENDRMLITRNIMLDLEQGDITEIELSEDGYELTFNLIDNNYVVEGLEQFVVRRRLAVVKEDGKQIIRYGKIKKSGEGNKKYVFDTSDVSYYEKELTGSLNAGKISFDYDQGVRITIPLTSLYYTDKDYSIKLFDKKMYQFDVDFNVDGTNYVEGYLDNEPYIYMLIKVDGKDLGDVSDLCTYYPKGTELEIYGVKINGVTTIFSESKRKKIVNSGYRIKYKFQTDGSGVAGSGLQMIPSAPEEIDIISPYEPCRTIN